MKLKKFISSSNLFEIINFIFVVIIFGLPFVYFSFVLNPKKIGQELYLVSVIAIWGLFQSFNLIKIKSLKIKVVDFCYLIFLIYCIFHYYIFSYFGFLYNEFWVFLGYILLYYLFKSSLKNEKSKIAIFNFTIILIWILSTLQSFIGLLQQFYFIKSDNDFFKVVGTFVNPNYLGVSMMIGLITALYIYVFHFFKNRILIYFLALSVISMIYVIILTQSRASWMTLFVAITIFFVTSKKNISFLNKNKIKTIWLLCLTTFITILSLHFLYKLNTDSVDGRAFIAKITLSKVLEKPILGNGIFNFRGIYNNTKALYFLESKRPWEEIKVGDYVAYVFNDYLQIIFEIGIVGLILIVLILIFTLKGIRLNPQTRFGLTLILSFSFLAIFTSVLYNPNAMIYVIWALCILVVFGKKRDQVIEIKNIYAIKGIVFLLIGIFIIIGTIFYKKTTALSNFKSVVESVNQKIYYKLDNTDLLYIIEDEYVEFLVGYENYQEGNQNNGFEMMENSVKKNPIPKANIALSDLYLQLRKYKRTEQLLKMNIGIEPSRFEPRNNLLQFYINRKLHEEKIKIATEIVNLPVKIASPEVDVYKKIAQSVLK